MFHLTYTFDERLKKDERKSLMLTEMKLVCTHPMGKI